MLDGVAEGDFSTAFAFYRRMEFIIINNAKTAVIYHFTVTFHIGSFACSDYFIRVVGVLIAFQKVIFIVIVDIRIFRPNVNPFYMGVFFFYFRHDVAAKFIKLTFTPEKECINLFVFNKSFYDFI